jgi:Coenzyme PQQ synthesis protein D (PqqD)
MGSAHHREYRGSVPAFRLERSSVRQLMPIPLTQAMSLPVPHPDVVARALPDGSVLFHPVTEVYFGLNQTGTVVWQALVDGASTEEALVTAVRTRWPDAPQTEVVCHVRELLADLSIEALVVDTVAAAG